MNEHTPLTPETPDSDETVRLSETGATPPGAPATAPEPDRVRSRALRPLLIGTAAGVAVLLVGGAGAAIALSLSDDDDRGASTLQLEAQDNAKGSGAREGDSDSASPDPGSSGAPADAAALAKAIDAAVAEASGVGATSIEVERDGWDVDVALDDRREVEVHVALDGTATMRQSGAERDRDTDPLLDPARIAAIADAAITAAGGGGVDSISTDDGRALYEVSVDLDDGRDVDVELSETLEVISVDD